MRANTNTVFTEKFQMGTELLQTLKQPPEVEAVTWQDLKQQVKYLQLKAHLFNIAGILFHGNFFYRAFKTKEGFNIKACRLLKTGPVFIIRVHLGKWRKKDTWHEKSDQVIAIFKKQNVDLVYAFKVIWMLPL